MLTMHQLFSINGMKPEVIKLVRHGNAEIPVLDTFRNNYDKFEAYQSFQARNKFKGARAIAVFAPGRGTTALFLGFWDIVNTIISDDYTETQYSLIRKYEFPVNWRENNEFHVLRRNAVFDDFSERLIIDWGGSTVSWVQSKDKEIIELKGKNSIGGFCSYDDIQLSFNDLRKIMKNTESNYTWYSALSAVNGVYLIRDITTGKLYVGSAYGQDGIWGRWETYSNNGHGGNQELKSADPENFEFSILEIVSSISSADYVIERENRWKEKLGSRIFGLNKN